MIGGLRWPSRRFVRQPAGRVVLLLFLPGLLLFLPGLSVACSGDRSKVPATSTGRVTSAPTSGAPAPTVAPLTGLPGVKARPVVVVKIDNSAQARPQSGLQAADIVVEELVEGGLTRFAGLLSVH